jgi:hypothetical protein
MEDSEVKHDLRFGSGTDVNFSGKPATGEFTLKGNPAQPEKALTIVNFPGGSVEISRTTEGDYWAHIRVNQPTDGDVLLGFRHAGRVTDARIDPRNRYASKDSESELLAADACHFALRIALQPKGGAA